MPWPIKKSPELDASDKQSLGKGVFVKCNGCNDTISAEERAARFEVCPRCEHHHKLSGKRWRELLLDEGHLEGWLPDLSSADPLDFSDGRPYKERIVKSQNATGAKDAIEVGRASLGGIPVAYGAFLFAFMGGSMGSVVGDKIAHLFESAAALKLPVVLLSASGGARMQEGILSLMQMAKTVGARERHRDSGMPFISVLLDPTTGGVAASYALLGDVNIAEKGALIGFAGARVIETTIRQKLPAGFQRSEFLFAHGMVDRVTNRLAMKAEITTFLSHLLRLPRPPR